MDYNKVKEILDKYWEGEASLAEEKALRLYFQQDDLPDDLRPFKPMFVYFTEFAEHKMGEQKLNSPEAKVVKFSPIRRLIAIAAIFALCISTVIWWNFNTKDIGIAMTDTYSNPAEAKAKTKEVLNLVSKQLNKSQKPLQNLSKFHLPGKYIKQ